MPVIGRLKQGNLKIASQIKEVDGAKLEISLDGSVMCDEFIEAPNSIPSDAYYFPLGVDSKDKNHTISSVREANTVYENGSVWVGTYVDNKFTDTDFRHWSHDKSGFSVEGTYNDIPGGGIVVVDNNSNIRFTRLVPILLNTDYTVSTKFRKVSGTPTFRWQIEGMDSGSSIITRYWTTDLQQCVKDINGWQLLSYTFQFTDPRINKCLIYFQDGADYTGYTHSYMMKEPQLVQKPFAVPFANIERQESILNFNFNSSIGLDWNANWSIAYWKLPVGTNSNNMVGYNIESIGCNGNSVGGDYIWCGKLISNNSVMVSNVGSIPFTNYFNKWHMVSIVKNGSTITHCFWGIDGNIIPFSQMRGTIASNAFVTPYGYDFKMGGWDDGNPCNTYYRDLVVAKRALTDTELQEMYYTQMRAYNTGTLQIRDRLTEDEVL